MFTMTAKIATTEIARRKKNKTRTTKVPAAFPELLKLTKHDLQDAAELLAPQAKSPKGTRKVEVEALTVKQAAALAATASGAAKGSKAWWDEYKVHTAAARAAV